MNHLQPAGWMERTDDPRDGLNPVSAQFRFHSRNDCERIKDPRALVRVDRPYHAPRCTACAGG